MTSEEQKIENDKLKERVRLLRLGKVNSGEIEAEKAADKERKSEDRASKNFEQWEADCEIDKERKKKNMEKQDEIEKEFEKISSKFRKREFRNNRNGKEKLQQNLKAKKGMRVFREEGRLKAYASRTNPNKAETDDWKKFSRKSEIHADMVDKLRPDIIQQLNQKAREERERLRIQKEKEEENENQRLKQIEEDGGEWVYNPEYAEYSWVGEGEPKGAQDPDFEVLTEEELRNIKIQEERWLEAELEEQNKRRAEKRKEKQDKLKAAMGVPIEALPEREKCAYEKLRDKNIKEREEAMENSGFFEDFENYKKKIGFS